jgi:hypothetical protein
LACGGAFLQSLRRTVDFDRGFDPERLLIVSIPSLHPNADAEFAAAADRIQRIPGVEAAGRSLSGMGSVGYPAMVGTSSHDTIGVGPQGPSIEFVEPGFLRAAGHRVLAGRLLTASDRATPVVVLTESLANRLWPRGEAVGSCLYIRAPRVECRTVVGVVRDVRWFDVGEAPILRAYLPIEQAWTATNRTFMPNMLYVRMEMAASSDDVSKLHGLVAPMLSGGEGDLSVWRVAAILEPQRRPWMLAAFLFLVLGGLGLATAVAGIHGLVAYDVTQRCRELGVRIALGASSASILRLVVTSGVRVVLLGVLIGALVAVAFGRIMASLLFHTSPYDPITLLVTMLVLTLAAVGASLTPARRAIRVDPVVALSSE